MNSRYWIKKSFPEFQTSGPYFQSKSTTQCTGRLVAFDVVCMSNGVALVRMESASVMAEYTAVLAVHMLVVPLGKKESFIMEPEELE